MFFVALLVFLLGLVLTMQIVNNRLIRHARKEQAGIVRLLGTLITARMRKGDFLCYCGGTLRMGETQGIEVGGVRQTVLECERCKAMILLPIKEGQRVEG